MRSSGRYDHHLKAGAVIQTQENEERLGPGGDQGQDLHRGEGENRVLHGRNRTWEGMAVQTGTRWSQMERQDRDL